MRTEMTQPERLAPRSTAPDYDYHNHMRFGDEREEMAAGRSASRRQAPRTACFGSKRRGTGHIERLKARCGATAHPIARVILTHEAGRGILAGAISDATRCRSPCDAAFEPSRRSPGTAGEDGCHRRRDAVAHVDGVAAGRASRLFDGSNPLTKPMRKRGGLIANGRTWSANDDRS
jgi:hypothetical protein